MTKSVMLSAAVALSLFAACSKEKGAQKQEKIIPVKTMEIATSQTANRQHYVGTVEESVAVALSFAGMGTVAQVFVSEGQKVAKGQLLATLNTATAQSTYDASQAKLIQAQDAYDRLLKVHENGSLPDIKFAEIEANLQQAKSMAAISKKSLDDCRLYAPRNGVIAARNIEAGSSANPAQAAFKLIAVDRVKVKIAIPENEIGSITIGLKANITVPALNNAAFAGQIEMKGVEANTLSHTYEAKIAIDNTVTTGRAPSLLPGMVCKVEIENSQPQQSEIVLPNPAIQIAADNRHFVWLAANGVAKRQFVKTGSFTDNGIVVSAGLSAGDKVIVEGMSKVSEEMRISITNYEL